MPGSSTESISFSVEYAGLWELIYVITSTAEYEAKRGQHPYHQLRWQFYSSCETEDHTDPTVKPAAIKLGMINYRPQTYHLNLRSVAINVS